MDDPNPYETPHEAGYSLPHQANEDVSHRLSRWGVRGGMLVVASFCSLITLCILLPQPIEIEEVIVGWAIATGALAILSLLAIFGGALTRLVK